MAELKLQIEFLKVTHSSCGDCNKCADGMGKVFDENLYELKAKVLESGSGAYFSKSGELMTGAKDYFGFVTFSAEMTENGIKCTMY